MEVHDFDDLPSRTARFLWHGEITEGLVKDDRVVSLAQEGTFLGTQYPLISLASVRLLPPCTPRSIVDIGRNYREHAAEMEADLPIEPLVFLKPVTTLIGAGE